MPNALCNVGSEPEDVHLYKQAYWFSSATGRKVFLPDDINTSATPDCKVQVSLLMSPNGLGWYHMEEIKDPSVIRQLLTDHQVVVHDTIAPIIKVNPVLTADVTSMSKPCMVVMGRMTIDEALQSLSIALQKNSTSTLMLNVQTGVNMNRPPKLTGYEILVRLHLLLGHAGLALMLATLAAMPDVAKAVKPTDIDEFIKRGCGLCDTALMIRPPIPHQIKGVKPPPGASWVRDTLSLRVKQHGFGYLKLTTYWDEGSGKCRTLGHEGMSSEDFEKLDQQIRIFNRPHHGEILSIKSDNLAAQKSKELRDYLIDSSIGGKWSVPYLHEWVGGPESSNRHVVPRAMALLNGCPTDGGEEHFFTAFNTVECARNETVDPKSNVSANMVYHNHAQPAPSTLWMSQCLVRAHGRYQHTHDLQTYHHELPDRSST